LAAGVPADPDLATALLLACLREAEQEVHKVRWIFVD
jgi:hypothetical protein